MTKILCGQIDCKYSNVKNECECKNITLNYRNMATVNEGRVDMLICNQYEMSDEAKQIKKELEQFLVNEYK